jgi:CHRD domain-containing protein
MRAGIRWFVAAAVVAAVIAGGAYAVSVAVQGRGEPPQSKEFHARLNGYQETPAVSSTGFGEFRAKLVDDTTLHYVFTYGGLEGGASLFAHVHFGTRYVAAGVSFFLCGGSTKPDPCPNVEGTVEGDVTPADVVGPNGQGIEPGSFAEILRAMRAGTAYANIHTTRWPGGEIRGQINDDDQKEWDK